MSYDIELLDKNKKMYLLDKPLEEGGTHEWGGNMETCLNITYNYGWYYYMFLSKTKGIRWLYGKKAKNCTKRLKEAIKPCIDCQPYERDYWASTPGNCIKPLKIFLIWCKKYPEGTFEGD